jgi:hypothetical protein
MPGYANTGIAEVIPKSMFQMEQETLVFWETDDGKSELQHQVHHGEVPISEILDDAGNRFRNETLV